MSNRIINENKSFSGSNVYLTNMEKEALKRAIDQYIESVNGCDINSPFAKFFREYDEKPLSSAFDKLTGKHKRGKKY